MIVQTSTIEAETLQKNQMNFQDILSDDELDALFTKHNIKDKRKRKLFVRWFFWLMIFSAAEPSRRGSLLQLIGFFLGAIAILFPESNVTSLSKVAVSKRLTGVSWYLFRGVYNHLLSRYRKILGAKETKFFGRFKDIHPVDGSVIALGKSMTKVFQSVHKEKSSLKLNVKYSLKIAAVEKLQVSSGKRHDSRFRFVTQETDRLYLIDLGYWSFGLMKKIMDTGSFFVMRLKTSCDPLVIKAAHADYQHLVGKRLSEISDFLVEQVTIGEIDLTVQLSKAPKPRFKEHVRLVGLFHEGQWRFYVTNIVVAGFTPQLIYQLYAQRWQVEIFFNLIKNVLTLENIISKSKNGIMIEIYSALIFHLLTRIIIALAAQKVGRTIHDFSFERSQKLIRGFLLSHFHLFLQLSLQATEAVFQRLISIVATMGIASKTTDAAILGVHLA